MLSHAGQTWWITSSRRASLTGIQKTQLPRLYSQWWKFFWILRRFSLEILRRLVNYCWKPHRPPKTSHMTSRDNTRQLGGELASPCKECSARLLYKDFDSTPLIKCHLDSALVWSLSRVDGRCFVQLKKYNLETSTPSQFAPIRLRSSLHFAKGSWASLCPQAHKPKASSWSRQKGWFERLCSSLTPL